MQRDRTTGKIVVQSPNVALIARLAATALALVTTGSVHTILGYTSAVAPVVWAASDELLRGVNPFRQVLGAAVLAWEVFSFVRGG